MKKIIVAIFFLACTSPAALSQSFEAGLNAFDNEQYEIALRNWLPLADAGDANAQISIGFMYQAGLGVSQSYGRAEEWYREALNNGLAEAHTRLGVMALEGLGKPENPSEAIDHFTVAAQAGHDEAMVYLGNIYTEGLIVPRNLDLAIALFQQAWSQGQLVAFENLLIARDEQRAELGFESEEELFRYELNSLVSQQNVATSNLLLDVLETINCNQRLGPNNRVWPLDLIDLFPGKTLAEMQALAGLSARMHC